MLKQDSLFNGMLIGLILTSIVYSLLLPLNLILPQPIEDNSIFFISMAANLITMRIFLINKKKDHIGRGILLITILITIGYFIFYFKK